MRVRVRVRVSVRVRVKVRLKVKVRVSSNAHFFDNEDCFFWVILQVCKDLTSRSPLP